MFHHLRGGCLPGPRFFKTSSSMIVLSEKDYNAMAGEILGTVDMLIKDGHFFAYKHRIDEDRPYAHVSDQSGFYEFQLFFQEYEWITGNDLHFLPKKQNLRIYLFFPEFIAGSMDPDYLAWREFIVIKIAEEK